jgi:hypothetical protein
MIEAIFVEDWLDECEAERGQMYNLMDTMTAVLLICAILRVSVIAGEDVGWSHQVLVSDAMR